MTLGVIKQSRSISASKFAAAFWLDRSLMRVLTEYDYDTASQLTSITYKLGEAVLGDLTYEYDEAGRRTKIGGSYARINLPQVLTTATHDDANRVTQRDATSFTYDTNGNLSLRMIISLR